MAWFEYTVNSSSPEPPLATSGWLAPADSQPRVVAIVVKTSCAVSEPPLVLPTAYDVPSPMLGSESRFTP